MTKRVLSPLDECGDSTYRETNTYGHVTALSGQDLAVFAGDRERQVLFSFLRVIALIGQLMSTSTLPQVCIASPVDGDLIPIDQVADPVFAGRMVGDGVAIKPRTGDFVSPVAGTVTMLPDTRHAVGLVTHEGVEVLVHVGQDTVTLNGDGFIAHVAVGDEVSVGQPILTADLAAITAAGLDTITPVLVTNAAQFAVVDVTGAPTARHGEVMFSVQGATARDK